MNRFYLSTIAGLVVIILSLWTCNGCLKGKLAKCEEGPPKEVVTTVTKTDTLYLRDSFTSVSYVPKPYKVVESRIDSFISFETLPVDTAAILKGYTANVYYIDSQATQYGKVYISDTLSRNRIAGRSVRADFTIPVVTNTVTNTVREPKRTQVYFGINAQGRANDLLTAFGPSLMLKTKGDKVFEIGALYHKDNFIQYQAGIKFKISFTKK